MIPFLKLIRWPNLLIMAFTQYMVRWFLLIPILNLKAHDLDYSLLKVQMTEIDFFLLVLSTVMIGAAGYIINDYFDIRVDSVNRPNTNVVGKVIKRRVAMGAHMTINIIGAGLGLYLSWKYNFFRVGSFLFISAPALLWFYSTNLKRQFLVGNLVIALLSGIVPMMVILFEIPNIYKAFPELVQSEYLNLTDALHVTQTIALFAFIVSLLREIIKDVEDYEGDMEYGCKTMPIVIGLARTKIVLATICSIVIVLLGWLEFQQISGTLLPENFSMSIYFYFTLFLQLPLIYLCYRILTAKGKSDWRFTSLMVKLIMVVGISFLFLYAHQINALITADVS
ncbi:MAG: geranylgeranylglycerol-phosphate geranylgeranyltransferase [Bacteroidetes bacterium]|nr:geranylgeranylglycerol-phosphate geranylgeranyltransferase [Bacteroidota bacterium]